VSGPSFHINEARSGGNPELFFGTPLATNAQPGDANFDVGGSNALLRPFVRICETDGAPTSAGCVTDVTLQVTGSATGLAMSYTSGSEQYTVGWQTKQLVVGTNYRVEIWGIAFSTAAEKAALDPRWLFGWRDISNAPSVSSCNGTDAFCLINYGQTIPVRVRIERFAFCPSTRDCATQFVSAGNNANLQAKLNTSTGAPNAQLFIPAQTGTNFALSFEPCSTAEDAAVSNAIDAPTFGPCVKTETNFTALLSTPAIVSLCDDLDPSGFGLSINQQTQLALHHLSNDLTSIQALPEAWHCGTPTSGAVVSVAPKGALWLAHAVKQKVLELISPRPLNATAMIDRGGGGQTPAIFSFYKLALPSKFEYEVATDENSGAMVSSQHVLRAKVVDYFGVAVKNARVRWTVIAPPNDGATVSGGTAPSPTLTDAAGIAQNIVTLSSSVGFNVFHAFGRGIADSRTTTSCTVPPSTPSVCNGPRAAYDPFLPIHVPEIDPVGSGTEAPVELPVGTRLRFRVQGCSVTVDGIFNASEWDCAKSYSFNANTSAGTTPATLYVINNGTTLYMAVRVQRSALDNKSTLQVNFDNNNSWLVGGTGAAEIGDDVLSLDQPNLFTDAFLTSRCITSTNTSCWDTDASGAGTNDGAGAVANNGSFTTFELSHPLNTSDNAHDFSLLAGNKVGLFVSLQIGSGSNGKTVWPAFRNYQEFKVTP